MLNKSNKQNDALTLLKTRTESKLALKDIPEELRPYVTLDQLQTIYTALLNRIKKYPKLFTRINSQKALRLSRMNFNFAKSVQVLKDAFGQYSVVLETNAKNRNRDPIQADLLGKGTYKKVKKAFRIDSDPPMIYAHAKLKAKSNEDSREFLNRMHSEIKISEFFDSPHIIRYRQGAVYSKSDFLKGSVFSLCGQGTLSDVIDGITQVSDHTKNEIFNKLILAVAHMNERGYAHQDLKSDNILLQYSNDGAEPKIIDFGLTDTIGSNEGPCASSMYASPEILQHYAQISHTKTFEYYYGNQESLGVQCFISHFSSKPSNLYTKVSEYNDAWSLGIIGLDLFDLDESTHVDTIKDLEANNPILFHLLQPNRSNRLTAKNIAERFLVEKTTERIKSKQILLDPHEQLVKNPKTLEDSCALSIDEEKLDTSRPFKKTKIPK